MKTTKVLSAISAAALLGISSVALAQGTGSGSTSPGSTGGAPAGNTLQRQDAPSSGSTSPSTQNSGSMSKDSVSKDSKDSISKDGQKQTQGKEMGKDAQKSQAQEGKSGASDSKSQMSQDGAKDSAKDGAKSGSTVGAAPAGAVNLTTEQRTTIRQTVLTSNAPRATNINFSINVGTAVPSSVRIVEVPDTIITIQPRWKGYRYFVYNDEIIIVEPRTLKIVAVLNI